MENSKKDLIVIEKAKEMGDYLFQITGNAPNKFRFTFVSRMQNLMLDIIENLYRANSVNLSKAGDTASKRRRTEYQREAKLSLDILCYIAMLARTQQCILPKQYEQISLRAAEVKRLIYG